MTRSSPRLLTEDFTHGGVGPRSPAAAGRTIDATLAPIRVRRSGETEDIIRIAYDPNARLVRAQAAGAWSVDETHRYLSGLSAFVRQSRLICGTARILLDRRGVCVQSPAVADLLAKANGSIFKADDKIAFVVDSSIVKTSLRLRMPHPGSKAFLSIQAAETWLSAFGS
jgi:hypothetical protein